MDRQIAYLKEFMTAERFEVLRRAVGLRTRYMTVCLENIFHPQNASAVVRSCEAFGIQDIHAVEVLTRFKPNVNIVRGTDKWIDIHRYRSQDASARLIARLKGQGYRIVATSPHIEDTTPEAFDVTAGPFALFFGTEHAGISDTVRAEADEFIKIPMYGMVESLNISVCAAILLYMLSRRVHTTVDNWPLPEEDQKSILFRWMMSSVKDSRRIMERFVG
ncbi:MAG: RNA methyltransferase [Rikenellaceae bacterium]|jgi:tRNA (guanosine-2'-O-)-methyltransferase|nr:RNA methyltransferase [Rikenellaceae bacterium]